MNELKMKINYTVACVNEFAKRFSIETKEAFNYLFDYKGIDFIKEHYDIEHTLSIEDAIEDLAIICRNNGLMLDTIIKEDRHKLVTIEQQMVEYMIQNLVEMICENQGVEYDLAMRTLYDSEIYDKITDVETGLYRERPAYVYGLLKDDIDRGQINNDGRIEMH